MRLVQYARHGRQQLLTALNKACLRKSRGSSFELLFLGLPGLAAKEVEETGTLALWEVNREVNRIWILRGTV